MNHSSSCVVELSYLCLSGVTNKTGKKKKKCYNDHTCLTTREVSYLGMPVFWKKTFGNIQLIGWPHTSSTSLLITSKEALLCKKCPPDLETVYYLLSIFYCFSCLCSGPVEAVLMNNDRKQRVCPVSWTSQ